MMKRDDRHDSQALPSLDEVRRAHVLQVLAACDWNQSVAAQRLGIDRKTLGRRLSRWRVQRP
jgi:transcriptional regulator of acetoin/glycerol metabolism